MKHENKTCFNQARFRPMGILTIYSRKKSVGNTALNTSNQSPHVFFIDFANAFDSVERAVLWRMIECDGFPEKIIRLIKAFCQRISQVCICDRILRNKNCVHQGSIFPPPLFNNTINWIVDIA